MHIKCNWSAQCHLNFSTWKIRLYCITLRMNVFTLALQTVILISVAWKKSPVKNKSFIIPKINLRRNGFSLCPRVCNSSWYEYIYNIWSRYKKRYNKIHGQIFMSKQSIIFVIKLVRLFIETTYLRKIIRDDY